MAYVNIIETILVLLFLKYRISMDYHIKKIIVYKIK